LWGYFYINQTHDLSCIFIGETRFWYKAYEKTNPSPSWQVLVEDVRENFREKIEVNQVPHDDDTQVRIHNARQHDLYKRLEEIYSRIMMKGFDFC
jgi:hypothetical protein